MKKYLILLIAACLLSGNIIAQNCHIEKTDVSGFNTADFQGILETAACDLRSSLPSEFANQFKVVEYGFYMLTPSTTGGVQPMFEQTKLGAAAESPYYLLVTKQSDSQGLYTKFWVDIKLPQTGVFSCLNESKLALIKEAVTLKIEEKYTALGRNPYQYAEAEIAGMNYLKSIINSIKAGICCPILPETIKNILLAKGYKTIPVNLKDKPPARPGENANKFPASVEDKANMLIEMPERPGFIDMAIALDSDVSFATIDGITAKAIITKNSNFCDAQIFQRVQNGFSGEGLQAYIHCHYWENPDTLQPDLLIAKIEYVPTTIALPEVVVTGQTGACGAVQLPTEPGFYNYAVTMDNGVYYGYNWGSSGGSNNWGGQWNKSDIVEYPRPNTYILPSEIAEAEHMWADGGVKYNPFIAPYFLPCWRTWFLQHVESTSDLEDRYHYWFTEPGLRLTAEREIAFKQFRHPDIVPPSNNIGSSLHWKCDSKVSRQIHDAPIMNTELVKLEGVLKAWLTNHYNLDDLFSDNRNLLDPIQPPNLSSLLIPSQLALFGGTQGLKIQVRSLRLLQTNCNNGTGTVKHFHCEVFFTVYDNMGVGISDAKRWHPGLIAMWILQHHRNYECSPSPCYIPITDHAAQIFHSFEICIGN